MDLAEFRKMKDEFFAYDHQSPLTHEQQHTFEGLKYFPEDPKLRFRLDIEQFPEKKTIQMQTSTGDAQTYTRYGKVKFEVEGQSAELTAYKSQHGFFIPFVDTQADKETYGAGRYLDPEQLPNEKLVVDFNLAYNPYCAYNEMYSCPIPPAENRLKVAIKAGEMNYK